MILIQRHRRGSNLRACAKARPESYHRCLAPRISTTIKSARSAWRSSRTMIRSRRCPATNATTFTRPASSHGSNDTTSARFAGVSLTQKRCKGCLRRVCSQETSPLLRLHRMTSIKNLLFISSSQLLKEQTQMMNDGHVGVFDESTLICL